MKTIATARKGEWCARLCYQGDRIAVVETHLDWCTYLRFHETMDAARLDFCRVMEAHR